MAQIGDKIRIISMQGESHYNGKVGIINHIGKDCDGMTYYRGTWGGLSVYPDTDKDAGGDVRYPVCRGNRCFCAALP